MKLFLFTALISMFLGCGGDAEETPEISILDQPLQGVIDGEPWTFKYGIARDTRDGEAFITMTSKEANMDSPCRISLSDKSPRILMSYIPEVFEANLSLANNLTFSYGDFQNDVSTTGEIRFDFVDDNMIRGALVATMRDHKINGNFELVRCPDPFAKP